MVKEGYGQFLNTDFAPDVEPGHTATAATTVFWRCYRISFSVDTYAYGIYAGIAHEDEDQDPPRAYAAIFEVEGDEETNEIVDVVASVTFEGESGPELYQEFDEPVTLSAEKDYIVGSAIDIDDTTQVGTQYGQHYILSNIAVDDILGHPRINSWVPEDGSKCIRYHGADLNFDSQPKPEDLIGYEMTDYDDDMSTIGFLYMSEVLDPEAATGDVISVSEFSATVEGAVTDTGGGECTCRIEYSDSYSELEEGEGAIAAYGELGTIASFEVDLEDLEPETTYYYRASVVNESGSDTGRIESFSTSDMPQADPPSNIEVEYDGVRITREETVEISWDSSGILNSEYELERQVNSQLPERIYEGSDTYYEDEIPVLIGDEVRYRVRTIADNYTPSEFLYSNYHDLEEITAEVEFRLLEINPSEPFVGEHSLVEIVFEGVNMVSNERLEHDYQVLIDDEVYYEGTGEFTGTERINIDVGDLDMGENEVSIRLVT